ncbi:MAG: undecaprenyl-diphosphate phosphatase [Kiritimatiellia bacterium]
MLEVTLLSVLQGIAEFLPISSSGHLVLGKHLLGLQDAGLRLDVFLHLGTLLAIFAFYLLVIRRIVVGREWSYALKVVASAIPAGVVGLCHGSAIATRLQNPTVVGVALLFTGLVVSATRFLPKGGKDVSYGRALWMGLAQAVAILPGVSRSGMTIAAARLARVDAEKCAEFSFLMSAPPIAGAALLEFLKGMAASTASAEVGWGLTAYGCLLAALVGYCSLKLLVKSLKSRWFWLFGPYCIVVGALTLACRLQ